MHGSHQKMENETIELYKKNRNQENKHKKNIRGQITIFIIIILVVGMVFMVLTYLSRTTIEQQQEVETVRKAETRDVITSVQAHVQSCLDQAAKEGLLLLGKQGGYIYLDQHGPAAYVRSDSDQINSEPYQYKPVSYVDSQDKLTYYIPYVVHPDSETDLSTHEATMLMKMSPLPPRYPWSKSLATTPIRTFSPQDLEEDYPQTHAGNQYDFNKHGPFGTNNLVLLEKSAEMLSTFVNYEFVTCLDWDTFKEQGLDISAGKTILDANTWVNFTDASTIFIINYSINVTNKASGDVSNFERFETKVGIRYKAVYDTLTTAIALEIEDPMYDIGKAKFGDDGIGNPTIIFSKADQAPFTNTKPALDTVYAVSDTKSEVDGKPYVFSFVTKNRPPALWLLGSQIKNADIKDSAGQIIPSLQFCGQAFIDSDSHLKNVEDFNLCAKRSLLTVNLNDQLRVRIKDSTLRTSPLGKVLVIENGASCQQKKLEIELCSIDPDDQEVKYAFSLSPELIPVDSSGNSNHLSYGPLLKISSRPDPLCSIPMKGGRSSSIVVGEKQFAITLYTYDGIPDISDNNIKCDSSYSSSLTMRDCQSMTFLMHAEGNGGMYSDSTEINPPPNCF